MHPLITAYSKLQKLQAFDPRPGPFYERIWNETVQEWALVAALEAQTWP